MSKESMVRKYWDYEEKIMNIGAKIHQYREHPSYQELKDFENNFEGTHKEFLDKKQEYIESYKKSFFEKTSGYAKELERLRKERQDALFLESNLFNLNNGRKIFDYLWVVALNKVGDGDYDEPEDVLDYYDEIEEHFLHCVNLLNKK